MKSTNVRWMRRRDLPAVLSIERATFYDPWSEEEFLYCLRRRNCIAMVCDKGNSVVAYMLYELHKQRIHLLNIAVHPNYRRQDVGSVMVNELIQKLDSTFRCRISLDVRESNLEAQLFFKKLGFRAVRILRDFYEDTGDDAYQMEYRVAKESKLLS